MATKINYNLLDYNTGLLLKELKRRRTKIISIDGGPMIVLNIGKRQDILFDLTISQTSYVSAWIASDKFYSKKILEFFGVPVPEGGVFDISECAKIIQYADSIKYPVVVKPLTASHGLNVYSNLENQYELLAAIDFIKKDNSHEEKILIEKHLEGEEYRLFITRLGFFAAVNRVPASIVGDGNSTITKLVDTENFRRTHPRNNCLCTIKIDDVVIKYLNKNGRDLNSVPKKGETVKLCLSSNVARGGNCIDVTAVAHESIRNFAKRILSQLTGLAYVGIDLICENIRKPLSSQKYGVCELNCAPGLSLHTAPAVGRFRDSPGAVADLIFQLKRT